MDADHSRPSAMPAKLRWRPYFNGTTVKSKKSKKETSSSDGTRVQSASPPAPGVNAKALAHKVRGGGPHYAGKPSHPPAEVQLQWEEAETIESMGAGGLPHNQHHKVQVPNNTHQPNIRRQQTKQSADHSSTLPSPPLSSSKLDLVGGQSDLSHYRASLPSLRAPEALDTQAVSTPLLSILNNNSYHQALTALLENHRSQMRSTQSSTLGSLGNTTGTTSKRLSSSELLGISTIEDLLQSCGYVDESSRTLASPATTDQSYHSSPETMTLDGPSVSPDQTIQPSILSTRNTAQLNQTLTAPVFTRQELVQGLSSSPFAYLSSNRDPLLNNMPSAWPSLFPSETSRQTSPQPNEDASLPKFNAHRQNNNSSQAEYLSPPSSGVSVHSSPELSIEVSDKDADAGWFKYLDESSPLFADADTDETNLRNTSFEQDAQTTASIAPTLFNDARKDDGVLPTDGEPSKTLWNWTEEMLRPAALSPTGHHSFTPAGTVGRTSPFGTSGGLLKGLQGVNNNNRQQTSKYHTSAVSRTKTVPLPTSKSATLTNNTSVTGGTTSAAAIVAAAVRGNPLAKTGTSKNVAVAEDKKDVSGDQTRIGNNTSSGKDKEKLVVANAKDAGGGKSSNLTGKETKDNMEGYGGLLVMFRGLWKGVKSGPDGTNGGKNSTT
ncbi:hypothetical protein BGZ94_004438 [Podila epigama]|nr:hypothetical protein BGZ94_004438 [Podila epigama]